MRFLVGVTAVVLVAGCGSPAVRAPDRAALWDAAIASAKGQGFAIQFADEKEGMIVGSRLTYPEGSVILPQRLDVRVGPSEGEYEAQVLVMQGAGSLTPMQIPGTETTRRFGEFRARGGRCFVSNRPIPLRALEAERAVLRGMVRHLGQMPRERVGAP